MTAGIDADWIVPQWDAPPGVHALFTTRGGGVSCGPFGRAGVDKGGGAGGMNLRAGIGDDPVAVAANLARLQSLLPAPPRWLDQVHGARVVDAEDVVAPPAADAATALRPGVVCAVQVADCLPVLLAERRGRGVAAAHAGWRGLAAGVIQVTVAALRARIGAADVELVAWLGPAIGPTRFEVGAEVREAMRRSLPAADAAFVPAGDGKFHADLVALARQALLAARVTRIAGGHWCTASDPARFYSFRRDRTTGRHAALIWRD